MMSLRALQISGVNREGIRKVALRKLQGKAQGWMEDSD